MYQVNEVEEGDEILDYGIGRRELFLRTIWGYHWDENIDVFLFGIHSLKGLEKGWHYGEEGISQREGVWC